MQGLSSHNQMAQENVLETACLGIPSLPDDKKLQIRPYSLLWELVTGLGTVGEVIPLAVVLPSAGETGEIE